MGSIWSAKCRGVRVHARSAMGMPDSETALEELMCRVLGNLIHDGVVVKISDDLCCRADSPAELLYHWKRVLQALSKCNLLKLSASKTVINPKSTVILGWIWEYGTLQAFPNGIAQPALSGSRSISLPRPDDELWIITDGAVKTPGIGATLYVSRNNKLQLAGFFSARPRGRQVTRLPCKIEALSIAAVTNHFSPYIIQSKTAACILTDNKPCVQPFEKLCRDEFSSSPRVATFLSIVTRYQASVRHVSGAAILPSDFASRNAPE